MTRSNISLKVIIISLLVGTIFYYAEASCSRSQFACENGRCIYESYFCDNSNSCGDNSDEKYCNVDPSFRCPIGWTSCPNKRRCIPSYWMCDGRTHCPDVSENSICEKKEYLVSWILQRRKSGSRLNRWGLEVHRIAVSLHLADANTFRQWNITSEGIKYELTIRILHQLSKDKKISSQELALYIHALLVACIDPRDFYGHDLIQELRNRVEASVSNYTNPFLILVLCNAGDVMTSRDVARMTAFYDSQHRPFWTDSQALATMALSCIVSRSDVSVDNNTLQDMLQDLKRRQFSNGTVDNFRTTALVTQALLFNDSYKTEFDLESALQVLYKGFNASKSLLNAYYALPAISHRSLLDVDSSYCIKETFEEDEISQKLLDLSGKTITIRFSVWIGDDMNQIQTWRVKMSVNSTIYDAVETVAKVTNGNKVDYNVVNGKPYVSAWNGKQDDPEMGVFWFVHLKTGRSQKIVEESPVDVKLKPNQEIILWYRRGSWSDQSQRPKTDISS